MDSAVFLFSCHLSFPLPCVIIDLIFHKGGLFLPPLTLLIKPASGHCNMRCQYCFYADEMHCRTEALRGMMSSETLETIISQAAAYAEGYINCVFQGGEPTLVGLDFYRELILLQKKYSRSGLHFSNSLQTNGLLIDDDWAQFLSENHFLTGLSLDGTTDLHDAFRPDSAGHGTFRRVLAAAQLLKKHKAEFNILCVISNPAARHGAKIYRTLTDYGFEWLQFIPCIPPLDGSSRPFDLTPQRYLDFLLAVFSCYEKDRLSGKHISIRFFDDILRRLAGQPITGCGMNGRCYLSFTIESDGDVYPCDFYAIDRYLLGNIHENSFSALADSEPAKRFLEESFQLPSECSSCEFSPLCRGGCRRDRDAGAHLSHNRWCRVYREFYKTILSTHQH